MLLLVEIKIMDYLTAWKLKYIIQLSLQQTLSLPFIFVLEQALDQPKPFIVKTHISLHLIERSDEPQCAIIEVIV